MRAAAIFGMGCSPNILKPFQKAAHNSSYATDWRIGLPTASDAADAILLFGGDGTVHRHLPQLVSLRLPLLVVPAGSGNDFARALGIGSIHEALAAWHKFCTGQNNARAIDLGVVSALPPGDHLAAAPDSVRHYFCTVAGVGLACEVARRAQALPRWLRAHGGYALALVPALFRFAPLPVKISTLDQEGTVTFYSHKPTVLAAFANTATFGDGMKIAPAAKIDDGRLDICLISGIDPFKLFCMFPTVYSGRHLNIQGVEYFQALRIRVATEAPADVYADGEYVCKTPVEICVHTLALPVIAPGF